ncbi:MAG: phosphoglycerate mutase (2,3-diphosphoglycerate-independent) [Candidatus Kerfeldbacteria bacterium RIFCSPLOWO2_01_FULL_48_11]|uniref:2,3-bisphosphoglycerate-independent phosphoglycerate mutase n=1 Tax=Candidatus Kerfeldbacteria bacterium RIFCSPLOWO2_01_FULL_48_11 TaxID=1798543 RepID=A0A1G2B6N7_9BACT|nr:MAG: 2,3-bisphosphoglycerate-independent phosphoglycerate mutase [Parcubacteria group bacterium GW2011_GWC2_49_9]OGY84279.1 MAG: phosphoglycerate mutase (2,3-diphosphoglycerate-independent) [Candidatus Kerfeldbacteria bacterium RIFCSPLOWO2_01_FULL_48_11]HCJ52947.1 2,3-bisphosphoglycerate-independent phosphoglycerate mutase [Candidatus Kerfeldbacteria bacterium]
MKHALAVSPIVLVILDGWGVSAPSPNNAITQARTPTMDHLWSSYPHTVLEASGIAAGLPPGQAGNSEAGHLNIGAGRLVEQDAVLISHRINDGSFFRNPAFLGAVEHVRKFKSNVHLIGLLTGDQSAHAYPEHIHAILQLLSGNNISRIYLHLITDGRDSAPHSAIAALDELRQHFKGNEKIVSIIGRFYAMDRIKEWERTRLAYEAMVSGVGRGAHTAKEAIMQAYNREENDEYIQPTVLTKNKKPIKTIDDNDAVIFFNLRSERVRQITKAFVQGDEFIGFPRKRILKNLYFASLTDFGPELPNVHVAYPFRRLSATLPNVFEDYRQLYISESEKYAHVTYFFNGGHADPVSGEDRVIIKSPRMYSYSKKPEMNAEKVTEFVLTSIEEKRYDFIVVNFPNADMLGHTGNMAAAIQGIEYVDFCIGRIESAVRRAHGLLVIAADHGNADEMVNMQTGEVITEHSNRPVPFIVAGDSAKGRLLKKTGALWQIASTILEIANIKKPKEMTRNTLWLKPPNP